MNNQLESYSSVVSFLGQSLPDLFMTALFDLTNPEYPVVKSFGFDEELTKKIRQYLVSAVRERVHIKNNAIFDHAITLDFSKIIKMSTLFIKSDAGELIGALCICTKTQLIMKMSYICSQILKFNTNDFEQLADMDILDEAVSNEVSLDSINEVALEWCNEPTRATIDERIQIIIDLYDMGVYELKGAVAKTAEVLGISEQTVYRYIAKIKKLRS